MTSGKTRLHPFDEIQEKENQIILRIGRVHRSPAQPWKQQFTITIHNSLDNIKTYPNNNSEENPDYLESEELDVILECIRTYLLTRQPKQDMMVDNIMEDSG